MKLYSPRLTLCPLTYDDRAWVLALNQDPLWLRFIGSRGVNNLDDAGEYIYRVNAQIDEWGYGLLALKCRHTNAAYGLCGLVNRFAFSCPDMGFALLPSARGQGIGLEAGKAVIAWAQSQSKFSFLTAMTHPENIRSQQLLSKLGFNQHGYYFDKGMPKQRLFWRSLTT